MNDQTRKFMLDSFSGAMSRVRWFLITNLILSMALLLHVYMTHWSEHYSLLIDTVLDRGRDHKTKAVSLFLDESKFQRRIEEQVQTDPASAARHVDNYLDFLRTQNELRGLTIGRRTVPLLGIEVPATDFMFLLYFPIALLSTGTWLAVRLADSSSARILEVDSSLKSVLSTCLVFGSGGVSLVAIAHVLAFLLPWVLLLFGGILDLQGADSHAPGTVLPRVTEGRTILMMSMVIGILLVSCGALKVSWRLHQRLSDRPLSAADVSCMLWWVGCVFAVVVSTLWYRIEARAYWREFANLNLRLASQLAEWVRLAPREKGVAILAMILALWALGNGCLKAQGEGAPVDK
ncbi:MAG: hypothetical protein HZA54_14765 [Planctomycetes bacterium]|nr:hypothetical protein [Planctomycetota bacterium]